MQLETAKNEMIEELRQWGWWAQLCDSKKVQYYSQQAFDRERPRAWSIGNDNVLTITDERAAQIDACIAMFDEETKRIMRYRFVNGANYRLIAEWVGDGMSKDRAGRLIDNCVSFLVGRIGNVTFDMAA